MELVESVRQVVALIPDMAAAIQVYAGTIVLALVVYLVCRGDKG